MYTQARHFFTTLFLERNPTSIAFNRLLILLNLSVFALLALEWMYPDNTTLHYAEIGLGVLFATEYLLRLWVAPNTFAFVTNVYSIIDLVVLVSLFAPIFAGNLAILRVLRSLKILRTYYLINIASKQSKRIAQKRGVILAGINFFVFLGIMTAVVFVAESQYNPHITTYLDALYFSVATLTTTGYGDITLVGPYGRPIAMLGMLFGITLFLRLAHIMFSGTHVAYTCPSCGLDQHDIDASHCKHCGRPVLHSHHSFA